MGSKAWLKMLGALGLGLWGLGGPGVGIGGAGIAIGVVGLLGFGIAGIWDWGAGIGIRSIMTHSLSPHQHRTALQHCLEPHYVPLITR